MCRRTSSSSRLQERRATASTVLSVSEAVQEDVGASPPWLVQGRGKLLPQSMPSQAIAPSPKHGSRAEGSLRKRLSPSPWTLSTELVPSGLGVSARTTLRPRPFLFRLALDGI